MSIDNLVEYTLKNMIIKDTDGGSNYIKDLIWTHSGKYSSAKEIRTT